MLKSSSLINRMRWWWWWWYLLIFGFKNQSRSWIPIENVQNHPNNALWVGQIIHPPWYLLPTVIIGVFASRISRYLHRLAGLHAGPSLAGQVWGHWGQFPMITKQQLVSSGVMTDGAALDHSWSLQPPHGAHHYDNTYRPVGAPQHREQFTFE